MRLTHSQLQAWRSLSLPLLRRTGLLERNDKRSKDQLIDFCIENNCRIPDSAHWHFLLKSVYEGLSKETLLKETHLSLYTECCRLNVSTKKYFSTLGMVEKIIDFIDRKGLVVVLRRRRGQESFECQYWAIQCLARGLDVPARHLKCSILEAVVAKHDEIERERMKLLKDPELPVVYIAPHRATTVIIWSRVSSPSKIVDREYFHKERDAAEQALREGRILPGLQLASYTQVHRRVSLTTSWRDSKLAVMIKEIMKADNGSQIVLVIFGIDGLMCREDVWDSFINDHSASLRLTLIIGENKRQWRQNKILWSHHDWAGPVNDRYWAICDGAQLMNAGTKTRLYTQIREQWTKCEKGRTGRREGIATEERPITGRNRAMGRNKAISIRTKLKG